MLISSAFVFCSLTHFDDGRQKDRGPGKSTLGNVSDDPKWDSPAECQGVFSNTHGEGLLTDSEPLTAGQIRAARAFLDWTQTDLADRTRLGLRTIKRVESGDRVTAAADLSIRNVLQGAGVAFVAPEP
jgi:DNA-binding transcriptional regulator YiaG